eukprot:447940_1
MSLTIGLFLLPELLHGLGTFVSNTSHWRSLSAFVPIENTAYSGIYLEEAVSMEYKFIYHGRTSNTFENVFRVGKSGRNTCNEAGTRYPSMWLHPSDDSFLISISHQDLCWETSIGYHPIQRHKMYQIYIEFNETWRFVSISDDSATIILINSQRQSPTPTSLLNTFMNVWISSDHNPAANVTLYDISIRTWNPTSNTLGPTSDPTAVPSSNPTVSPSIKPTLTPTTRYIVVFPRTRPPTHSPFNDGMVSETTMNTLQSTFVAEAHSYSPSWIDKAGKNYYVWLGIPSLIVLLCLVCCVMTLMWKKKTVGKAVTPPSRNEEDLIFDKIYNKQIQINIEQQRQHEYGRRSDILLPDEDSASSGAAEELFVPQTRTATLTTTTEQPTSVDLNVSVQEYNVYGLDALKAIKSLSFTGKQKKRGRYSPQLQREDHELHHKVTLTIADKHGHQYESDTTEDEEDVDVDAFHAMPPSSGVHSNYKRVRNRLYVQNPKNATTASYNSTYSQTSVIYEKPTASGNDNDDETEELYGKGKDPMSSPGCEMEGSQNYRCIEQWLKVCDDMDWEQYLNNFKRHKVNDYRLDRLSEKDWKQLIPPIGTRNEFKTLWRKYERQRTD